MKCPKCNVEMVPGKAIEPKIRERSCRVAYIDPTLSPGEVKIIDCLKCPMCGHSDDGVVR